MSMAESPGEPKLTPPSRLDEELFVPTYYTPGHAKRKALMVVYGIVLFLFGLTQLWTPLRLLALGNRVRGETTSVTKTKAGLSDLVLTDDSQIQANLEPRDRSYVFWNEFRFHTADGGVVNVRAPVGSQLKPLYTLLDPDGLPTTDLICYNPAHPQEIVFPLIISTWFAPGMIALSGLVCAIIGAFLFYWAKKPIELPYIPPLDPTKTWKPPGT